jgi:integrase/recombinase XerD
MKKKLGTLIACYFRNYLINERNCSKNTIASYRDTVSLLLNYICSRLNKGADALSIMDINTEVVLGFLDYLEAERHNSARTRNQRLFTIKNFFRYIVRLNPELLEECERVCQINTKKVPHKVIESLKTDEVDEIIKSPDVSTKYGIRDHALLLLMHNTGARVQEICDLKIADLTQGDDPQVLITGKGRKQRVTPIWGETLIALQNYLATRDKTEDNMPLFLNVKGKGITRFGIGYILKKYTDIASKICNSLQKTKISPHTLRHTTALNLIQSGVDIVVVKEWLGHADIQTTMLYLEINIEMKQEALKKCPAPKVTSNKSDIKWRQPAVFEFLKGLCRVELC